jgi:excisionase family DNA binding protein
MSRLLTADDLAARWQVPKSQIYRLTRENQIPAVRLGKYYRYRVDAIEAFELGAETATVLTTTNHSGRGATDDRTPA